MLPPVRQFALRSFTGAVAVREIQCPERFVPEHRHDWPSLLLPVLGQLAPQFDDEYFWIRGPAAVLHPPNAVHAASIGTFGLEAVNIEFDPAWLRAAGFSRSIYRHFRLDSGNSASAAAKLARAWMRPDVSEGVLASATAEFLNIALGAEPSPAPIWLGRVQRELAVRQPRSTREIARDLNLHPAWLAQAFHASAGEGLREARRRRRVENAAFLLRYTEQPLSAIAADAGFFDQSHMNRCFKIVMGRSPLQVRREMRRHQL